MFSLIIISLTLHLIIIRIAWRSQRPQQVSVVVVVVLGEKLVTLQRKRAICCQSFGVLAKMLLANISAYSQENRRPGEEQR